MPQIPQTDYPDFKTYNPYDIIKSYRYMNDFFNIRPETFIIRKAETDLIDTISNMATEGIFGFLSFGTIPAIKIKNLASIKVFKNDQKDYIKSRLKYLEKNSQDLRIEVDTNLLLMTGLEFIIGVMKYGIESPTAFTKNVIKKIISFNSKKLMVEFFKMLGELEINVVNGSVRSFLALAANHMAYNNPSPMDIEYLQKCKNEITFWIDRDYNDFTCTINEYFSKEHINLLQSFGYSTLFDCFKNFDKISPGILERNKEKLVEDIVSFISCHIKGLSTGEFEPDKEK